MNHATLWLFLTAVFVHPPAQPPSLAGHWVIEVKPGPADRVPTLCFLECEIVQTDKTILVKARTSDQKTYTLDGTSSTRTGQLAQYTYTITTTARWENATLIITATTVSVGDGDRATATTTTKVRLENGRLIVEQTNNREAQPIKSSYVRKPGR